MATAAAMATFSHISNTSYPYFSASADQLSMITRIIEATSSLMKSSTIDHLLCALQYKAFRNKMTDRPFQIGQTRVDYLSLSDGVWEIPSSSFRPAVSTAE